MSVSFGTGQIMPQLVLSDGLLLVDTTLPCDTQAATGVIAGLGLSATGALSFVSGHSDSDLSVTVGSPATAFVATAKPSGIQQRGTTCYSHQVNQLGVQSNVDSGNAALAGSGCW